MDVSRRDFFKVSSAAALTGTALGGLTAVGASPAPAMAQAQDPSAFEAWLLDRCFSG